MKEFMASRTGSSLVTALRTFSETYCAGAILEILARLGHQQTNPRPASTIPVPQIARSCIFVARFRNYSI